LLIQAKIKARAKVRSGNTPEVRRENANHGWVRTRCFFYFCSWLLQGGNIIKLVGTKCQIIQAISPSTFF